MESSTKEQVRTFMAIAIPSIGSLTLQFLVQSISIFFVGHLNDSEILAGVGLGAVFINLLGYGLIFGLNGAVDTLVSQNVGNGNLYMCGVTLNRARIVLTGCLGFWILTFLNCKRTMIFLNISEVVAEYSQLYVINLLPAIYFMSQFDALRRFLNCQGLSYIPMLVQVLGILFHLCACHLFVNVRGYKIVGISYAMSLTEFLQFFLLTIYCYFLPKLSNSFFLPNMDTFRGMGAFLKLGFTGAAGTISEFSTFELMTVMASMISVEATAGQLILKAFTTNIYMIPLGMQMATAAVVGIEVGKGEVKGALNYAKLCVKLAMSFMVSVALLINLFKSYIPFIFTGETSVASQAALAIPFYTMTLCTDSLQSILMGISRGLSIQTVASALALVCYYFVGFPTSYCLGVLFERGLGGLWLGQAIGQLVLDLALIGYLWRMDWVKVIGELVKGLEEQKVGEDDILEEDDELEMKLQKG